MPLLLALASALGWAVGTVYLKWARVEVDPIASAVWQIAAGFVVIAICQPFFESAPLVWPLKPVSVLAVAFNGLIGVGLAYFVWFSAMERLPAGPHRSACCWSRWSALHPRPSWSATGRPPPTSSASR